MNKQTTNRDMQRLTFVESLYNSLRKQTAKVLSEHKKFVTLAKSYIKDGLDDSECIELLVIDGLSREAAENYTTMASGKEEVSDGLSEYSFQFEDSDDGTIYSSYDIGKVVRASTDEEAREKAEEILDNEDSVESAKLISVNRI